MGITTLTPGQSCPELTVTGPSCPVVPAPAAQLAEQTVARSSVCCPGFRLALFFFAFLPAEDFADGAAPLDGSGLEAGTVVGCWVASALGLAAASSLASAL